MSDNERHFEVMSGFPPDVLAVAAHGKITRQDYEDVLIPQFEDKLLRQGVVKLLLVFGEDFAGYSPGAAWDDAKFGFLHLRDISGVAIVSDLEWLRYGVKTFAPLIGCPVALFQNTQLDEARQWLDQLHHEQLTGP